MISLRLSWLLRRVSLYGHISALAICILIVSGCRGKRAGESGPASYSQTPQQTVDAIMAMYDANKDGVLDANELEKCPSLKTLLTSMNKGPAGKITAAELTERIAQMQNAGRRPAAIGFRVLLEGVPLAGATVTITPELFHGQGIPTCEATTNDDGRAAFKPEEGFVWGFYRMSVSKLEDGKETIPSRYNSPTTLGVEFGPETFGRVGGTVFNLKN